MKTEIEVRVEVEHHLVQLRNASLHHLPLLFLTLTFAGSEALAAGRLPGPKASLDVDQAPLNTPTPENAESKTAVVEGMWSFDVISTQQNGSSAKTSTLTAYSGLANKIVVIPSVLGGAPVTRIASQAFGHHSEIIAVYVPDSVSSVADWAFYDLNSALIIAFANAKVTIDEAAFQSSANAALFLPSGTNLNQAGGKTVTTTSTNFIEVQIEGSAAAAIAGGRYLNVSLPKGHEISIREITALAVSADRNHANVQIAGNVVTFSGTDYVAKAQIAVVAAALASEIQVKDLRATFRGLTTSQAIALNAKLATDHGYAPVASRLTFKPGSTLNGGSVKISHTATAVDVETGKALLADAATGLFPSTSTVRYKYIAWLDTNNDGRIERLYYSPFSLIYDSNSVSLRSSNPYLDGLSARDTLDPVYLAFANGVISARGKTSAIKKARLILNTTTNGAAIEAAANENRSILWATDYGSITVRELHARSTSVGNWSRMSYEAGLPTPNTELVMQWGMNALLYATNGGSIIVGTHSGPTSTLTATGDGANGIVAGAAGVLAGTSAATVATSSVWLYNARLVLKGWNNHVADVVYGGYASLDHVHAVTGIAGSYAVGQASALANDFGNGVVETRNSTFLVHGNRSAGAYVIGGGIITATGTRFTSKMDAGLVVASGGTFHLSTSSVTGQIALRNRGGINPASASNFDKVTLRVERTVNGYVTGDMAAGAMSAWILASGTATLAQFLMSSATTTMGTLCDHYQVSATKRAALYATLSRLAKRTYTNGIPLRNSLLDNTFYNYSASAYTGHRDYADVPFLTPGSAFGGLVSAVIESEGAGTTYNISSSRVEYGGTIRERYLIASESGSAPVVNFSHMSAAGIIWNEGDVDRDVEGQPGKRKSSVEVNFINSVFAGSFADGSNGLWDSTGSAYANSAGKRTRLNGNFHGAVANWGTKATFGKSSKWHVTHTSYLGHLTLQIGAVIRAPKGYRIGMSVDGVSVPIVAGSYSGRVVVEVTPIDRRREPLARSGTLESAEASSIKAAIAMCAPQAGHLRITGHSICQQKWLTVHTQRTSQLSVSNSLGARRSSGPLHAASTDP